MATCDVQVEGIGQVTQVPASQLRAVHGRDALEEGDEVIVDLKNGKWARGSILTRVASAKAALEPSSEPQNLDYDILSSRSSAMGAAMSTAVSASASGSGGELATARLAEMLMVFKHDVRRLKADRERLQQADNRLQREREELRCAVATANRLRDAEERSLMEERSRLEAIEATMAKEESNRREKLRRHRREKERLRHAVRAMELAREMRTSQAERHESSVDDFEEDRVHDAVGWV